MGARPSLTAGRIRGRRIYFLTLALLLIISAAGYYFNSRLRPVFEEAVASAMSNIALGYISDAVCAELGSGLEYDDIITLSRSETGEVLALTTNMGKVNLLQSRLAIKVLERSERDARCEITVPLGTIIGINLYSGAGPMIDLKAMLASDVGVELISSFSSAGINQTLHRIFAEVTLSYKVFLPGKWYKSQASSTVLVAETVVIGHAPDNYVYITDGDYAGDAAGNYITDG